MVVYILVIPSGAVGTLEALSIGALFAAIAAWGLRVARAGVLARLSAWAGTRIGGAVMRKTLGLPLDLSARLGVENNLVRIRSMEGVRQFIGGSGGASLIDYPFVVVVLLVIALLGGWIVFVPLVGLLLFAALSWPLSRFVEARANQVGRLSRVQQEVFTVAVRRLRALRGVGGSVFWRRRMAEMVAQQAEANRDFALANALVQSVGSAIGMLTVLGTMGVGILLVLDGGMSTGGLIATMMLIWRVTAPAQQAFAARVQWRQIADSARQLDRLMQTAGEQQDPQAVSPMAGLAPALAADRAYYRFSSDHEPALAGVSFAIEPGQMLAVIGPNGAGKTTLLECLAGIRAPQSGMITVGGRDIRQFDPADYRAWSGYLPQGIQSLPLTVGETMRLRVPTASDAEILAALERAAGTRWWAFLGAASAEGGLTARIDPWGEDRDAVRVRFIVKLASATLGDPPLVILDDPLGDIDPQLESHFQALLAALRGRSTIVIATHRPDLIQQADCVAILNNGALAHFGPVGAPKTEETQGSAA
jgi:ABC-type bacteriocin/lantibiotic exporter with double-glycine peptidase domain